MVDVLGAAAAAAATALLDGFVLLGSSKTEVGELIIGDMFLFFWLLLGFFLAFLDGATALACSGLVERFDLDGVAVAALVVSGCVAACFDLDGSAFRLDIADLGFLGGLVDRFVGLDPTSFGLEVASLVFSGFVGLFDFKVGAALVSLLVVETAFCLETGL